MLSLVATVLAQITSSPSEPPSWGNLVLSIVSGIPVAAVLGWRLKLADDQARAKDALLNDTNEKLLELAERALPVLAEASRALGEAARHHDGDDGGIELRRQLRRVQAQLDDLGQGKGG